MALYSSALSFSFVSLNSQFSWLPTRAKGPSSFHRRCIVKSNQRQDSDSKMLVRCFNKNSNGTVEKDDLSNLLVCFGEMLIDFVPTTSGLSLAEAPAFKKAPANVAVGIARLGGTSAFIGKVGEDEFGYMLADILRQNNVNDEGMRFDPGARTALAFVTLRKDGEREFMFYRNPSADMLFEVSELDLELIKEVYDENFPKAPTKEAGVILSYDPNLRLPLWPSAESAREGILSIWKTADIIKEFSGRVGGLKVECVDTTGTGDTFVSGVLSQLAADTSLLQDENWLREALRFANACGALTVTERGAIPALPTRETVLDALLKLVCVGFLIQTTKFQHPV